MTPKEPLSASFRSQWTHPFVYFAVACKFYAKKEGEKCQLVSGKCWETDSRPAGAWLPTSCCCCCTYHRLFVFTVVCVWLRRCPRLLPSWGTSACRMPTRTRSWWGSPPAIIPSDPPSPAPCSEVGTVGLPPTLPAGDRGCTINYTREEINYTVTCSLD